MANYELLNKMTDEEIIEGGKALRIALDRKTCIEIYRRQFDTLGFVKKDGEYYVAFGANNGEISHAVLFANRCLSPEDVETLRELAAEKGMTVAYADKKPKAAAKELQTI